MGITILHFFLQCFLPKTRYVKVVKDINYHYLEETICIQTILLTDCIKKVKQVNRKRDNYYVYVKFRGNKQNVKAIVDC